MLHTRRKAEIEILSSNTPVKSTSTLFDLGESALPHSFAPQNSVILYLAKKIPKFIDLKDGGPVHN